ncbi:MAG: choice-of-anchor Q domain-containing protein [Bacteroidota bacterium]
MPQLIRFSRLLLLMSALLLGGPAFAQTTFIVDTPGDTSDPNDGLTTLREAIEAANADATADIILMDPTLLNATVVLSQGTLTVTEDVTIGIPAAGGISFAIDAARASRAITVENGTFTVFDVTFVGGQDENGGALFVAEGATTNAERCAFTGNVATGDEAGEGGGALFTAGTVTLTGTNFTGNVATTGAGNGGALFIAPTGSLTMTGGALVGNIANRAGGAVENDNGTAVFTGVLFEANTAGPDADTAVPGNGGAIHVSGMGTTTITGGSAFNNRAWSEGGAFWNAGGVMTIDGTQIGNPGIGNTAGGGAATNGGGGLFNIGGTLNVANAFIVGNAVTGASGSGGGILADGGTLNVANTEIRANTSMRAGGGIETTNGAGMTLQNVNFFGNNTGAAPGNGGAVHVTGSGDSDITGGIATGNTAASEGGAFWNGTGTMTIDGTQIGGAADGEANVASGDAADTGGGGVFNAGGTLNLRQVNVLANVADGAAGSGGGLLSDGGSVTIQGGVFDGNTSVRAGGGIETTNSAMLSVTEVTFLSNTTGGAPGNGGAIHVTGPGMTTIVGGMAMANTAASEGGAFWNGTGTMTIDGTEIGGGAQPAGNVASGAEANNGGGGLFNAGGTLIVKNAFIGNNRADGAAGSGGGILNDGGTLQVDSTVVRSNTANRAGGGIESTGVNVPVTDVMTYVSLVQNTVGTAPGNGGGYHITGPGMVTFDRSLAAGNDAGGQGGGLWNSGAGTMTIVNATISGNSAPVGGGLYQQPGDTGIFTVQYATVAGNTATGDGGGFFTNGSIVPTLDNVLLALNSAGGLGDDCAGTFDSAGHNLIQTTDDCTFTGDTATNVTGVAPMVGPLADNGGPTLTHALMDGSPAIDAGFCVTNDILDQRGFLRMDPCDIGAFDAGAAPVANEDEVALPTEVGVSAAYPNPFADAATLTVVVDAAERIRADVYDTLGRRVQQVFTGIAQPGQPLALRVDGTRLPTGTYFVRVQGETFADTKTVTLVR